MAATAMVDAQVYADKNLCDVDFEVLMRKALSRYCGEAIDD